MKIENNIVPAEQVSENDKLFANQSEEVKEKGLVTAKSAILSTNLIPQNSP